jgi:hypothetical protein
MKAEPLLHATGARTCCDAKRQCVGSSCGVAAVDALHNIRVLHIRRAFFVSLPRSSNSRVVGGVLHVRKS